MNLRDALLASLANLPGSRQFHLHVLVSFPRKHSNLYPFASQPRPKTYLQDILILLSEQAGPDARRLFVSAIEASVYHIPSTSSAIVYVSKSPTSTLVRAFLSPLPVDHLWIHLFARAQSQYLFPNSADFPGKTTVWASWKLLTRSGTPALRQSVTWVYGHPYSQTDIPLPGISNRNAGVAPHIGQIIPWFDDDPKARFIDEIAYTTEADWQVDVQDKAVDKRDAHGQKEEQTTKTLKKVSVSEFWERMSFRQECIAGAITGFFVMAVSSSSPQTVARSEVSPLAPQPGQVAPQLIKRVLASLMTGHEFPSVDRAAWSTKVLEESIRGLCDGLGTVPAANIGGNVAGSDRSTPEPTLTSSMPQTPPPRLVRVKHPVVDASPNPFPEPATSLETYNAYIYGSLTVDNPGLPRKTPAEAGEDGEPKVTVLTVRRKKRAKP
ncbi:hypothetical protein EDD15DRAFT_2390001 [Pisolithus albus]|nr:hypothetical protein EDD15DRAFT_2390001 [Pisolithus albus]